MYIYLALLVAIAFAQESEDEHTLTRGEVIEKMNDPELQVFVETLEKLTRNFLNMNKKMTYQQLMENFYKVSPRFRDDENFKQFLPLIFERNIPDIRLYNKPLPRNDL